MLGEKIKRPDLRYLVIAAIGAGIGALETAWRVYWKSRERQEREAERGRCRDQGGSGEGRTKCRADVTRPPGRAVDPRVRDRRTYRQRGLHIQLDGSLFDDSACDLAKFLLCRLLLGQ
jgi:hypothetical protein